MPGEEHRKAEKLEQGAATAHFAATAKARRKAAGLSQEAVSRRCGLDVAEISRLERGKRDPQLWTIIRLARGLGIEPAELLEGLA